MTNNRIRIIMAEQGITAEDLAKRLPSPKGEHMSVSGLNQHIIGNPSVKVLQTIADALNVPLWQLFVSAEEVLQSQKEEKEDFAAFIRCNGTHYTADSLEEFNTIVEEIRSISK